MRKFLSVIAVLTVFTAAGAQAQSPALQNPSCPGGAPTSHFLQFSS